MTDLAVGLSLVRLREHYGPDVFGWFLDNDPEASRALVWLQERYKTEGVLA
jgi:hypothetical protein